MHATFTAHGVPPISKTVHVLSFQFPLPTQSGLFKNQCFNETTSLTLPNVYTHIIRQRRPLVNIISTPVHYTRAISISISISISPYGKRCTWRRRITAFWNSFNSFSPCGERPKALDVNFLLVRISIPSPHAGRDSKNKQTYQINTKKHIQIVQKRTSAFTLIPFIDSNIAK